MIWGWRESAHPCNQLTPQPAHPPTLASLDAGGQMPQAHPRMPSTSLPCWWWEAGLLETVVSLSPQLRGKTANATSATVTPSL